MCSICMPIYQIDHVAFSETFEHFPLPEIKPVLDINAKNLSFVTKMIPNYIDIHFLK